MPGDNAAPPTHRRAESIVCTSLVLLSSPAHFHDEPQRTRERPGERIELRGNRKRRDDATAEGGLKGNCYPANLATSRDDFV